MEKNIVILTKSRKHGGYCIAGIDIDTHDWIRIVSDDSACKTDEVLREHLTYQDETEAQVLDVVNIKCKGWDSTYYQPENIIMDEDEWWIKVGEMSIEEVLEIHPHEQRSSIYFDTKYRISEEDVASVEEDDAYSLLMIKLVNPTVRVDIKPYNGEKSVVLNFRYNGRYYNYFRATDDEFFGKYYDYETGEYRLPGTYIAIISLGEVFDDGNHYKLIAKLIPYTEPNVVGFGLF